MSEQLQPEARDSAPAKPNLTASLFDLRSVIGLLFAVYGLVLTVLGSILGGLATPTELGLTGASPEDLAKAGGIALNLWGGLVMLVVGLGFFTWVWLKPPLPPQPHDMEEGGPLHHGYHDHH